MEQLSKTFSSSCQNKNSGKDDIKSGINFFQKKMFMAMVDTPDVSR